MKKAVFTGRRRYVLFGRKDAFSAAKEVLAETRAMTPCLAATQAVSERPIECQCDRRTKQRGYLHENAERPPSTRYPGSPLRGGLTAQKCSADGRRNRQAYNKKPFNRLKHRPWTHQLYVEAPPYPRSALSLHRVPRILCRNLCRIPTHLPITSPRIPSW